MAGGDPRRPHRADMMGRYVIRRGLGALLVLIVVSILTFAVFMWVPVLTGADYAYLYAGRHPSPAQVQAIREKLGFDKPVTTQYLLYMKGIFTGRELLEREHDRQVSDAMPRLFLPAAQQRVEPDLRRSSRSRSPWPVGRQSCG